MPEAPQHEKTLIKVIIFSTAISFGALGAIIASMTGFFHGEISFHFSIGSIAGFIVGFVLGWLFWKLVFNKRAKDETVANDLD
jgi:membrane associated rhomboid family serine protease